VRTGRPKKVLGPLAVHKPKQLRRFELYPLHDVSREFDGEKRWERSTVLYEVDLEAEDET
jgi:hypothetical protein